MNTDPHDYDDQEGHALVMLRGALARASASQHILAQSGRDPPELRRACSDLERCVEFVESMLSAAPPTEEP